jgi:predicted nucleic acid-binding protein
VARSFIDTNVLVYADTGDDPVRQRRALDVLLEQREAGTGVISTQVLQEFVIVALCKLRLPSALIRERLAFYSRFEVVPTSPALIEGALDLHVARGVAFYDALIAQAAVVSGCEVLLSEDFQSGARLGSVTVRNPFE